MLAYCCCFLKTVKTHRQSSWRWGATAWPGRAGTAQGRGGRVRAACDSGRGTCATTPSTPQRRRRRPQPPRPRPPRPTSAASASTTECSEASDCRLDLSHRQRQHLVSRLGSRYFDAASNMESTGWRGNLSIASSEAWNDSTHLWICSSWAVRRPRHRRAASWRPPARRRRRPRPRPRTRLRRGSCRPGRRDWRSSAPATSLWSRRPTPKKPVEPTFGVALWKTIRLGVEFGYIIHGTYHPAAYIGHCRPEPNFSIRKPPDISSSSAVISATLRGAIGEHLRAESRTNCPNCRCGCLRDTLPGSHSHTCLQTQVIVFHSCEMAPTKRTRLTWKEKVVILDEVKLLKHGTSQRSATEQLDIIGLSCFHN